jgi:hypothetical protein
MVSADDNAESHEARRSSAEPRRTLKIARELVNLVKFLQSLLNRVKLTILIGVRRTIADLIHRIADMP